VRFACNAIKKAAVIHGVSGCMLDCLKKKCDGTSPLKPIVGGFWFHMPGKFKGGYTHVGSPEIHLNPDPVILGPEPSGPLIGPPTPSNLGIHTVGHEMVHSCGDNREGSSDPAEQVGYYVENHSNW